MEVRPELAPLFALRLRTPRLELRLPTDDDLRELYAAAEAGIHPPDRMPFGIAWTDDLNEADFVAFHVRARGDWSPERWEANLVSVLDGRVVGTQGIFARDFAETREVGTGSWLGAEFQGRGLGTEQRAAVLELAFRGLGARAATTGAIWDNVASQRVSEKLGYVRVGESKVSPRGEEVRHYDYRLEREAWRRPFPIELERLGPALPLFGVTPDALGGV